MYKYIRYTASKLNILCLCVMCCVSLAFAETKDNLIKPSLEGSHLSAKENKQHKNKGILNKLYGTSSSNSLRLGALAYHIGNNNDKYKYQYPYIALTVNNVYLTYFKNTFHRDTFGIGIERTWFQQRLNNDFNFNVNYTAGILVGGYCINGLSCKKKSLPVVPAIQIIGGVTYKDRVGLDLAWLASVLYLSAGYRF